MNKEYGFLGLYEHNLRSYKKIKEAFKKENIVGIVHATGTGKSYNALQLAYDNKNKKIIYLVPSKGIIEHIKKIIDANPHLEFNKDFSHLEFRTYQSLVNLTEEEIASIPCDLLILDEFHHLGAPIWGARIETFLDTHPNLQVFGMTAYTIRDRKTIYERDMINPETDELFSRKIVSHYDLCDAMLEGVLPKPIYKSAYVSLSKIVQELETKIAEKNILDKAEYQKLLADAKRKIHEAPGIVELLKENIKPNGKYIYFCPPINIEGTNDIATIKKEALKWFKEFIPEENIIFYTSTSDMSSLGKKNREAFYHDTDLKGNDVSNQLRVMFAINQYNEGIHAPNIDGVIMGRETTSDIVYFEQLGRALNVRGTTATEFAKLEQLSIADLKSICTKKNIPYKDNLSKEELIQKLIAPVIIDLTNNIAFIKELETNLQNRFKEIEESNNSQTLKLKINDVSFDINIINQDLYEILRYVMDRLTLKWEDYYEYAKIYFEHYGHLNIPYNFKTNDGFSHDNEGLINLGEWLYRQRKLENTETSRGKLLAQIGCNFIIKTSLTWEEMYNYAKIYFEHHHNLEVPVRFKTNDGYTYDANGRINLGRWILFQRLRANDNNNHKKLLTEIGMRFEIKKLKTWAEMYDYVKVYHKHHGNIAIPTTFKTNDGYTSDPNGKINLGKWLGNQRLELDPESKRGKLLAGLGLKFEKKITNRYSWNEMYEYAKIYFEHHGNLEIKQNFKTDDGYTYNPKGKINLGTWVFNQRKLLKPNTTKYDQLLKIGMRFNLIHFTWEEMYNYAQIYFEHHGNLEVPTLFKTDDGFTLKKDGNISLGNWIASQRKRIDPTSEKGILLSKIGMRFYRNNLSWEEMYAYAKIYFEYYGNLEVKYNFKTNDGYTYNKDGSIKLGEWVYNQKRHIDPNSFHGILLNRLGIIWNKDLNFDQNKAICTKYNIDYEKNKSFLSFISSSILQLKINFLLENNMPLTDENGLLLSIFYLNNTSIKEIYDVDFSTLMENYYPIPSELKHN